MAGLETAFGRIERWTAVFRSVWSWTAQNCEGRTRQFEQAVHPCPWNPNILSRQRGPFLDRYKLYKLAHFK